MGWVWYEGDYLGWGWNCQRFVEGSHEITVHLMPGW